MEKEAFQSHENIDWYKYFYILTNIDPKSLQMVIPAMKLKDAYSLEERLWPTYTAY